MFLAEPGRTNYDFHFTLMGVPCRVHPLFWLVALILGAQSSGNDGARILIWVGAMFVSILLHELGHSLAHQKFGFRSRIVLYHFGGLAIPEASGFGDMSRGMHPKSQIFISFAGPGMQFIIVGLIIVGALISQTPLPYVPFLFPEALLPEQIKPVPGFWEADDMLAVLLMDLLFINYCWALLNLVPVFPLDGGQIARNLFLLYGGSNGTQKSLILSVCVSAALAIWGFSRQDQFLAILFVMLGIQNYMLLQQMGGGGYGSGGYGSGGGYGRGW